MISTRRSFLLSALALSLAPRAFAGSGSNAPNKTARPVIHQTDLYRPHCDPDDHFDLAAVYALFKLDEIDLRGVVLDCPTGAIKGAPDVAAIAQLNRMTRKAAPAVVGTAALPAARGDKAPNLAPEDSAAIEFIIETLEKSDSPVRISIVGSASDVAIASARRPDLFREKCAGVYLDAGSAFPNPNNPDELEYNVALNPHGYATLFDLPCPLYWFPCWHDAVFKPGEYGSYYRMKQEQGLEGISDALAGYFAYMFKASDDADWLAALRRPEPEYWSKILAGERAMWSTASLLMLADKTVTRGGEIVDRTPEFESGPDALYRMENVDVSCDERGKTSWRRADGETNRKILRILDADAYPVAMCKALNSLLRTL